MRCARGTFKCVSSTILEILIRRGASLGEYWSLVERQVASGNYISYVTLAALSSLKEFIELHMHLAEPIFTCGSQDTGLGAVGIFTQFGSFLLTSFVIF